MKRTEKPSIVARLASMIFPNRCFCCGMVVRAPIYVCDSCVKLLEGCKNPRSKVVSYHGRQFVVHSPFTYRSAASSAVKRIKFGYNPDNAIAMADEIAKKLMRLRDTGFDVVTAIPMTAKDRIKCRYSHAELIAKHTAARLGVEFDPKLVKKIRQTKKQHTLSGLERRMNIKGAYTADENAKGKHVLLIDDVVTTGSTICECATELYKSGAEKVTCATFAATKYSN